jgi:hypothetical protein
MENETLTPLQRDTLIKMYNDIIALQKQVGQMQKTIKEINSILEEFTDKTLDMQKTIIDIKLP